MALVGVVDICCRGTDRGCECAAGSGQQPYHQQNYQAIIYDFCDDLFAVVLEDLLQNADDFVLGHTELLLHKAYSVYFVRTGLHGLDFLLRLLVFQRSYQDLLDFAHCPDQLLGKQLRQI